jgi:2',3'-cyclic-nucleotide 2'-phosphodiesterase (5'-nucleotidase family)
MADLPGVVRNKREKNPLAMLVDAGNFSRELRPQAEHSWPAAIALMNDAGYDAALPGSAELSLGRGQLRKLRRMARFPLLLTNVEVSQGDASLFNPFVVKECKSFKLSFLGVTEGFPESDLAFTDPESSLTDTISMLHDEGVGLFVVLSNLSDEKNNALIHSVKGINAIISLFDGTKGGEVSHVNSVPLARTPQNPFTIGSLSLSIPGL